MLIQDVEIEWLGTYLFYKKSDIVSGLNWSHRKMNVWFFGYMELVI